MTSMIKPPKYLVCVDGREDCLAALRLVCLKALARAGSVEMLHVTPPADFQTLGGIADRIRDERTREGEELLDRLMLECQQHYGIRPSTHLREGAIGEEIIAAAVADPDVMMVVIGVAHATGARGTLAAWLANQLGGKLPIPLLMVPGNLTQQQLQQLV
ncbi:MAG: universal stress protein [Rickettsiales bacterium]|jgi:nucleotide-binding universal stress UspA family protein|nr:universal stress protein [Rickettsiales bacterium]